MPKVTVIIPTYNRREYVQEAIDSVITQTFHDYDIIVIDDGSTDGTREALPERYGDQIHYVWQTNQGESAARNHALARATGHYIAFLDSDDLWLPDKLDKQVALLEQQQDIGAAFCQAWIINEFGQRIAANPLGEGLADERLTLENLCLDNDVVGPSTALVRRNIFDQVGGFDAQIHYGEDWDLWLRIAAEHRLVTIPEPLASLRRHQGTQSYYPSPEKNLRRLNDHLTLLNKAFATWPDRLSPDLRNTALARRYTQAALTDIAVNNLSAGAVHLQAIQGIAPDTLNDMATFGQPTVDYAALIAEDGTTANLEQARGYVQRVMAQLRTIGSGDLGFERQVLGRACVTLGFIAYQHHRTDTARRYFMQAMRYDRRWMRNRGVLSIMAESMLGASFMRAIRQRGNVSQQTTSRSGTMS